MVLNLNQRNHAAIAIACENIYEYTFEGRRESKNKVSKQIHAAKAA
jgi:hypothetical protein